MASRRRNRPSQQFYKEFPRRSKRKEGNGLPAAIASFLVAVVILFFFSNFFVRVNSTKKAKISLSSVRTLRKESTYIVEYNKQEEVEPLVEPIVEKRSKLSQRAKDFNKRNRIYCMVPTLISRQNLWESIVTGWGKRCDVLKFFVDPPEDTTVPPIFKARNGKTAEIVVVPMVRKSSFICSDGKECRNVWEKVWRSWVYVNKNDIDKAEWFVKIDDDSFFIPSNLRRFIREKGWSPLESHFFGHKVWHDEQKAYISGVCTSYSREAVRVMSFKYASMDHDYGSGMDAPKSVEVCADSDTGTEEKVTALCLRDVGIDPEETVDSKGREYVVPLGIPFSLTYRRKPTSTSWFWHLKPESRGDMENCCSPYAWGLHGYKSPARMNRMEESLYEGSAEELYNKLDSQVHGTGAWWHTWYLIQIRKGIEEDEYTIEESE